VQQARPWSSPVDLRGRPARLLAGRQCGLAFQTSRYAEGLSAVQHDVLSGDVAGVGGGQEGYCRILGDFFDANGQVTDLPLHDRRIGIELADLTKIPKVVGVAGGAHKAEAILGALRGGFLDVLVTNEIAAARLLELEAAGG
jgi:DNA-binding transcriptional regulator LsrR (DeoR family)